jgi:hypothetical protein
VEEYQGKQETRNAIHKPGSPRKQVQRRESCWRGSTGVTALLVITASVIAYKKYQRYRAITMDTQKVHYQPYNQKYPNIHVVNPMPFSWVPPTASSIILLLLKLM